MHTILPQKLINPPMIIQPQPQHTIQSYTIDYQRVVGRGNFSTVYWAINACKPTTRLAVKIININGLRKKGIQYLLHAEIDTLLSVHHENVIGCRDIFMDEYWCYIFTDFCEGGTVEDLLQRCGVLKEKEAIPIIKDVFEGLLYLEKNHIIHRDLKAANIFLNRKRRAVVADFGFATQIKQPFRDLNIGSLPFMAPEAIIDSFYVQNTDVWGFGCFVYQLFHGESPYARARTLEELKQNVLKPLEPTQVKSELSIAMKQLILSCLQINYEKRPRFVDLKQTWIYSHLFPTKKVMKTEIKPTRMYYSIEKTYTPRPIIKKVDFKKILQEVQYCRTLFKLISRLVYEGHEGSKKKIVLFTYFRILKLMEVVNNDDINYGMGNHESRKKKLKAVAEDYARELEKQIRKKSIIVTVESPCEAEIHLELENILHQINTMPITSKGVKQRNEALKNLLRELLTIKEENSYYKNNFGSKFEG